MTSIGPRSTRAKSTLVMMIRIPKKKMRVLRFMGSPQSERDAICVVGEATMSMNDCGCEMSQWGTVVVPGYLAVVRGPDLVFFQRDGGCVER